MNGTIPRIVCKDGFSLSVQASQNHYCAPRDDSGPYLSVEVGFPSDADNLLMEYIEPGNSPTDSVYGWVPSHVVEAVIAKHGGLDIGATLGGKCRERKR